MFIRPTFGQALGWTLGTEAHTGPLPGRSSQYPVTSLNIAVCYLTGILTLFAKVSRVSIVYQALFWAVSKYSRGLVSRG